MFTRDHVIELLFLVYTLLIAGRFIIILVDPIS